MESSRIFCRAGLVLAAALLAGCDDGGKAPLPPEVPGHAKDFYFAWRSLPKGADPDAPGGLELMQAEDVTQRITLATDGVTDVTTLYLGDPAPDAVENTRAHTLMYVRDGYWWKVSLRQGGSQVPVRAASTAVIDACLSILIARTPTSAEGAFLYYIESGADGDCFTDDDLKRRIPLSGSANAAALPVPAGELVSAFFDADGTLEGFLLLDNGALRLYDENYQHPTTVLTGVTSAASLMRLPEGHYLSIDGSIRRMTADGEVSAALDGSYWLTFGFADGDYIYFTDSDNGVGGPWALLRLPRNGSGPAQMMWDGEDNQYAQLAGATEDAIIVSASSGSRVRLYAVPRDAVGATSAPALEDFEGYLFTRTFHEAPLVYTVADLSSGSAVVTAKTLHYDGTIVSEGAGTEWVGTQDASIQPLAYYDVFRTVSRYSHIYWVNGVGDREVTGHQGAVLKARRLADGVDSPTLRLVDDAATIYLHGAGAMALGGLNGTLFGDDVDIVAVDLDIPVCAQTTYTDDRDEYVSAY